MTNKPDSERLALLEADVTRMKAELDEIEKRDRSRMRAAITTLGGLVMAMGSYIWHRFAGGGP